MGTAVSQSLAHCTLHQRTDMNTYHMMHEVVTTCDITCKMEWVARRISDVSYAFIRQFMAVHLVGSILLAS